jgi:transposase-like protein DUF772
MLGLSTNAPVPIRHLAAWLGQVRYKELAPYYSQTGRPSIDPVLMIRMLIVGYVFAIRSSDTRTRGSGLSLGGEALGRAPTRKCFISRKQRAAVPGHLSSRGVSATGRCGLHLAPLLSTFNSVDAVSVGDNTPGIGQCCNR